MQHKLLVINCGGAFATTTCAPAACSADKLARFQALVVAGGEVDPATLSTLVPRALMLGFVWSGSALVGVGGLKRPYATYRSKVFKSAHVSLKPENFALELGWVHLHVSAQDKHLTTPLVKKLVRAASGAPVYATSRVNNLRMHTSLFHAGFRPVGTPFPSDLHAPNIQLLVCP